jgi:phosphoribosylamine--glycine ligase
MKILVVGTGGREHALAWRLSAGAGRSPQRVHEVIVAPGNAGIARAFRVCPVGDVADVVALAQREAVDLVVVGPEAWLERGLVDALEQAGIPAFGPTRAAAALESSKAFMKGVARAAGVPTADFVVVDNVDGAGAFLASRAGRGVVVKADGLCAGKGVVVCDDVEDARAELAVMLGTDSEGPRFGAASKVVVLEDRLEGEEVSVFALCNGVDAVIVGAARDHKRVGDGDTGPNTGGMGAVGPLGPAQGIDDAFLDDVRGRFVLPTLAEMQRRGVPFRGVLFVGLMVHPTTGPVLLEYNVRFGDPETEALLFALDVNLAPALAQCAAGASFDPGLSAALRSHRGCAAVVVVAASGYPNAPEKGAPVLGLMAADALEDVQVFCAGVAQGPFGLIVDGGRVVAVAGRGGTIDAAIARAYAGVAQIHIEGAFHRRDIGHSVASSSHKA